jgi:mRNA interferase MazF
MDLIWLDFVPQAGREQAKTRPALVVTDALQPGLRIGACLSTGPANVNLYPFALPLIIDKVEGAVPVDQLQSFDWTAHKAAFDSKAIRRCFAKVRTYLGVLLGLR